MTVYVRATRLELFCSYCDFPQTVAARPGQLLTLADLVDAERGHSGRHAVEETGDEFGLPGRPDTCDVAVLGAIDVRSGPRTMVGAGEACVVCDEPFDQSNTFLFVIFESQAGVAHEDCVEGFARPSPGRHPAVSSMEMPLETRLAQTALLDGGAA